MTASVLLVQLNDKTFIVGDGELVERKDGALVPLSGYARGVVVGPQREDDLLLHSGTLGNFLIDDLEGDEVHVEGHVGAVADLRVEIEQTVVGVDAFEEVLNAEALAADMLHFAPVLLVDRLHDKTHEQRRFAPQLREVHLHRVVGAVRGFAIVDEVAHLDIQQQRFGRIADIERVERAVFGDDRHIGLGAEIAHGGFHTDDVLRAVGLACDQIRRAEIDVTHRRRKDDVHGLVVGDLQSVRRDHAVERELARETVIEAAVPLRVGIDLLAKRYRLLRRLDGLGVRYFLCVRSTRAQREDEHHYKNLFHFYCGFSGGVKNPDLIIGYLLIILISLILRLIKHDPISGFQMHFDGAHLLGDILARALNQSFAEVGGELRSRIGGDVDAAAER